MIEQHLMWKWQPTKVLCPKCSVSFLKIATAGFCWFKILQAVTQQPPHLSPNVWVLLWFSHTIDRATNPAKERVDELGVQMFCIVVRSNAQLVHKAQEMIVAKVRSSNVTEATRAIAVSQMPHTHTQTHTRI